jgi:uncharacterized protein (TIGR03083 family)
MATRTFRLDEVQPAFVEAWAALRKWLDDLTPEEFDAPSAVGGWTVGQLTAHIGLAMGALMSGQQVEPSTSEPAMSIEEWTRIYPKVASGIDRATKDRAEATADDLLGGLDDQWNAVQEVLARADGTDVVLMVRVQRTTLSDLLVTRLVEIVVHSDDLARSLPERTAPPIPREAMKIVVRTLLDVLATRAPGRSVEVRVPPFAAVQCIEGPRHTRGTPPNTIETDATTWIRLAGGRMTWEQALTTHAVSASGQRADLGAVLPLL